MFKTVHILSLSLMMNSVFAADVIPFEKASMHYDAKVAKTVEGTIAGTFCNDKMCFLNFDKDYKKFLSAVILAADFAKFSKAAGPALKAELDKMYTGKKVQITGILAEYKSKPADAGRPQISVTDSANVKVITK